MKKLLTLAVLGLCACETPAEISARNQLDAACVNGDLQACRAVQERVAEETQPRRLLPLGFEQSDQSFRTGMGGLRGSSTIT